MSVLLLGNGINLAERLSPDWNTLLKTVAEKYGFTPEESLSNTLGYEMLENRILRKNPALRMTAIHREIARGVQTRAISRKKDWSGTDHARLTRLPVSVILTTNYDYALERSADPAFRRVYNTRETTYSLRRCQYAGGKTIYHIHGECGYPRSICLGFEHYAGSLQRIREGVVGSTALTEEAKKAGHTYMLADILNGLTPKPEQSWIFDFFTEDMYILGLNLDACEIDLWWLLSYRAKQITMGRLTKRNEIHYLDVSDRKDGKNRDLANRRRQLLEAFDVQYLACEGEDFPQRYDYACAWLEDRMDTEGR